MKSIYPWAEMQVGDVRAVSTHRSQKAVYNAGLGWAKKHPNEDGSRPKFLVNTFFEGSAEFLAIYRIERTA